MDFFGCTLMDVLCFVFLKDSTAAPVSSPPAEKVS